MLTLTKKKKAGVAILISDNADCRTKKTIRDKGGHYLMIKGSILQEDNNPYHVCS